VDGPGLSDLTVDYDEDMDVLYVSKGAPRSGVAVEVEEGIVLRLDPDTQEIVGLTILDFRAEFGHSKRDLRDVKSIPTAFQSLQSLAAA
jgi:hypothetical protein